MNSPLLEKISQPSDLKKLSSQKSVNFFWITYQRPEAIWHPIWVLWS